MTMPPTSSGDADESAAADGREVDALSTSLSDENAALRLRVRGLEAQVREYESTMATLQASRSWRMTTPLRLAAGRARRLRIQARARLRSIASRRQPQDSVATRGLFGRSPVLAPARTAVSAWATGRHHQHRVLVVAHVHYDEVWEELANRLERIPEGFDLAVSVTSGRAEGVVPAITARFPHARIQIVPNRGRDQGPLSLFASWGVLDGYDAVLKVHTKRSLHRMDGDAWRTQLLESLLPSPEGIERILLLLRSDAGVGLIAPAGNIKGPEHWGSNLEPVTALAERIGLAFDPDDLEFPAGAMYWADPWVLQQVALLGLEEDDLEPEAGHIDGSIAHALERFVGLVCTRAGLRIVPTNRVASQLDLAQRDRLRERRSSVRTLAFYLPQYHRIPENDAWWGDGFTDWSNVAKAQPLFRGHRQPLEPGSIGHYDLSDPAVLRSQGLAVRARGVDGLVIHHYWFDGTRLLETPLRNLLADPSIDLPFALCWANEPWTRRWDGLAHDVLMPQTFGPGWADRFYDDIRSALHDPRYVRVNTHPLLVLYRVGLLPDAADSIARWRQRAVAEGLGGLHILGVVPGRDFEGLPPGAVNSLDGLVRFPPLSGVGLHAITSLCPDLNPGFTGEVYSYDAAVDGADLSTRHSSGLVVHPGVMPGWDNTARRGAAAYIFHGATPIGFRRWFDRAVAAAAGGPASEPLVFINAWNEWAEGAALEADAFAPGLPRRTP
jgi:lipopolysaccharide biosynthesis protein